MLECLGERTIALAQQRRLADPDAGYDRRLPARFERLLPLAVGHGVRVLTNMGAANPLAAGRVTRALLDRIGARAAVAVVTGDDVLDEVDLDAPAWENGIPLRDARRDRLGQAPTSARTRSGRRWTRART